jgi:hypothetical protein
MDAIWICYVSFTTLGALIRMLHIYIVWPLIDKRSMSQYWHFRNEFYRSLRAVIAHSASRAEGLRERHRGTLIDVTLYQQP